MGCQGADPGSAGWDAAILRAFDDAVEGFVCCQAACNWGAYARKVCERSSEVEYGYAVRRNAGYAITDLERQKHALPY